MTKRKDPEDFKPDGRPTLYRVAYNEQAYKLCLLGATDKELADFFEIAESTLNLWKEKHPKFSESLNKGKVIADANVAHRLYQRALGYEHEDIYFSAYEGKVTQTKYTRYYPPDPTACIFWLKNRRRQNWRDVQVEVNQNNVKIDDASLIEAAKRIAFILTRPR